MITFGSLIRSERIRSKISLQDLAKIIGVSPQYLSDMEQDRRNPGKIDELANALCLSSDYLYALAGRLSPDITTIVKDSENEAWKLRLYLEGIRSRWNTSD